MVNPRAGSDLLEYWAILVRRRWVIYLSLLSITVLALIGSFVATPLYRSTVTMQIERQSPDVLTFRDLSKVDHSWAAYSDFYQTQYKIIASPAVARAAVGRLGLDGHPMFATAEPAEPGLLSRLRAMVPSRGVMLPVEPIDAAAGMLLGGLEVAPVRNSHLVLVSYVATEPQLSADVANAIADAYVGYNIESQFSTSRTAKDFLLNQIELLKDQVQSGERTLQEYGEKYGILTIDATSNVTLQSVREVAAQLTEAQTVRAYAEARLQAIADAPPEALPAVLESPLIGKLRGDYALLESEYIQKAERFKADWPGMRELRSKLQQAKLRLQLEMTQIAEQVKATTESDFRESSNKERELERLLTQREAKAQNLKRNAIEYATLSTQVEKKREILDRLIKRQSEIAVSEQLLEDDQSTNIRIMDRAKAPTGPFKPNTRLNVLLGMVLGLMVGVGLANVLDYLDNSVKSAADLEKLTDVPLLAVIEHHGGAAQPLARVRRRNEVTTSTPFDLVAHFDPRAPVSEAYRELRTALLLSHAGEPPRRIMVTSGMPQEGKSATTMNLAAVLAQMDRRVLLVDTDLRRPRLHRALQVRNETGVSTYLSGLEKDPLQLVQGTVVDNLFALGSGPIPPNPSELLNSPRFSDMVQRLLDSGFDHIVFDSPPVLSVSEAVIMSTTVDSTILVVRAGQTPRQSVTLAVERLRKAGRQPTGIVLNDAKLDGQGAYQRYYYSAAADVAPGEPSKVEGRQAGGAA